MLKYLAFLGFSFGMWHGAQAAVIESYPAKGCRYEGLVNTEGKPHGQGAWQCADGRSYQGGFNNGKIHGKGVYSVDTAQTVFLNEFNVNSTKLNRMALHGTFKQGRAHGGFEARQEGSTVFVMRFKEGMMQEVRLPKAKK